MQAKQHNNGSIIWHWDYYPGLLTMLEKVLAIAIPHNKSIGPTDTNTIS